MARPVSYNVFDAFRKSLEDLVNRGIPADERRSIAAEMRDTLVQARMGLADMRDALARTRARLAAEERELATVVRRKQLAIGIGDTETVKVAEQYEQTHAERVAVLGRKASAQEDELQLAEREVQQMTADMKAALAGVGSGMSGPSAGALADDVLEPDRAMNAEIDALGRAHARAEREADADRRLEELKRRMGK